MGYSLCIIHIHSIFQAWAIHCVYIYIFILYFRHGLFIVYHTCSFYISGMGYSLCIIHIHSIFQAWAIYCVSYIFILYFRHGLFIVYHTCSFYISGMGYSLCIIHIHSIFQAWAIHCWPPLHRSMVSTSPFSQLSFIHSSGPPTTYLWVSKLIYICIYGEVNLTTYMYQRVRTPNHVSLVKYM